MNIANQLVPPLGPHAWLKLRWKLPVHRTADRQIVSVQASNWLSPTRPRRGIPFSPPAARQHLGAVAPRRQSGSEIGDSFARKLREQRQILQLGPVLQIAPVGQTAKHCGRSVLSAHVFPNRVAVMTDENLRRPLSAGNHLAPSMADCPYATQVLSLRAAVERGPAARLRYTHGTLDGRRGDPRGRVHRCRGNSHARSRDIPGTGAAAAGAIRSKSRRVNSDASSLPWPGTKPAVLYPEWQRICQGRHDRNWREHGSDFSRT